MNQTIKVQSAPFRFKKILNHVKQFFSKSSNCIIVFFGIVLTVTVIYPLFSMVKDSFTVQSVSEAKNINEIWNAAVRRGDFTFLQWPSLLFNKLTPLYSKNFFWIPLYRSVLMALIACTIAVVFGGNLAFFITRTNIPFKRFISTVFVFPYIMPSWSIAMFWENFFKNTNVSGSPGEGLLQAMTGISAPQWLVYGFFPTAIVLGLHYAPFAYILIGGILRNMDANLEEAATILKASRLKIVRKITLPIVAPAMISTVLLVFASSISSYTVPQFLNKDGSFNSISITLRSALMTGKKGEGYVIATILLIFSVLILTLNNWFTKSRRSFTTVSGKSGQITKIDLKKAKWPIAVTTLIIVTFFAVIPLLSFVLESLEETAGDFSSITLKYWISPTPAIDDAFVGARDYSERYLSQQHDFAFVRQNHHRRRYRFVYLRNLRHFDRIRRQQKQEKPSCQLRFQFGVLAVLDPRVEFQHDFLFTVEDECVSFFGRCDDAQRMVSRRAVHHRRRHKVFALCVAQRNERDAAGFG